MPPADEHLTNDDALEVVASLCATSGTAQAGSVPETVVTSGLVTSRCPK